MSNSSLPHQATVRRLKAPAFAAGVVAVLLLFVSAWGMMSLEATDSQKVRQHPAGQIQADARTLVAAFSFLFESDTASCPEAPIGASPLCASNGAVQPVISASLCCTSNQSESFSELITNVPARS